MTEQREEITDIIEELKLRYTPENFKKLGIKKGKVLTFGTEQNPVHLEITRVSKGRYWAKHVQLSEKEAVISHYRHNVDATQEVPYCTDCEIPVTQEATPEGKRKYEVRKERHLSDGTPLDEEPTDVE